jgi:hypothetical protein
MFAVGCELVVDFARTKIPVETTDAAIADVGTPDGYVAVEASAPDTGTTESDAGSDAADAFDTDAADASDR